MAVPYEMLLYPELLSNEQLVTIIRERHLRIENIERMSRCELIELFQNFCMPFGQRKHRESGRGRVLNKSSRQSPEPAPEIVVPNNNCNRKVPLSNIERLKPPPDILTGHIKRIKLENTCKETYLNNIKRKMSIDFMAPATDYPPLKKDRKPIMWP